MATVADLVVDALRTSGISTLFCLPGVQNDDFFNALVDAEDIHPIVARHEQGAALMALGAAQVTGEPASFCVVPGPGMLNAGAGLTSAYWTYSPVLAIIGEIPSTLRGGGTGTLHELEDQHAILRQLTKFTALIDDPATAATDIGSAVDELHRGLPRPVGIEVPVNHWAKPVTGTLRSGDRALPQPDPDELERAVACLSAAETPMIVVGSGAWGAGGPEGRVTRLAEALGAAVTTRRQGHGVVPTAHPLFVPLTAAHRMWPQVDVAIGIGTRLEWPLGVWGHDQDLTVVQINIDADELDRHGIGTIGLHGDADAICGSLLDALDADENPTPARIAELDAHRAWFEAETAHLVPQRAYTAAIREALPDDGVIVEDVTQIGFACHLFYDHRQPGTYLTTGAAGNLGAATAQAIGAAAVTDRPVVAIVGDGGFLFTATELATAVQHDIGVNIVLFNNNAFGNVRRIQKNRFGADRTIASTLQNPDFERLVEAFGVAYWRADSPQDLTSHLVAAIATPGPTLIEVPVEEMPDPWPFLRMAPNRPASDAN